MLELYLTVLGWLLVLMPMVTYLVILRRRSRGKATSLRQAALFGLGTTFGWPAGLLAVLLFPLFNPDPAAAAQAGLVARAISWARGDS